MGELRDRLTLSEIAGRRIKLLPAGREFKGCCPFHHEKTASFYVNDEKQFYHCFGCGAHGDVIDFVMEHDNLSFIEAVEVLAAQAGMQVPKQSPLEVETARKEKNLHALMDDAARFFQEALDDPRHADARRYLSDRGVSEALIGSFRLGFAPADPQALRKYLLAKEYTDKQMIDAGVIRPSTKGGEPYAFFRDRVMFPVADRRGRIVAFGGRVLPEHMRPPERGDFKPPKYINSSDTELFHKGRMLYGESHARQAAAEGQKLVVVEGYLDVMACFNAGWRGAVAPLGTALTDEQIMILWKMIPASSKVPVLCFDGDNAGRRAAARAAERILPLLGPNRSALFAFLPEGQDPDSLLRAQGKQAFAAVLEAAMPMVDFLWHYHTEGKRFETPEERAGLARALEQDVEKIADRNVQLYYRQAFQDKLRVAFGRRTYRDFRTGAPANVNARAAAAGGGLKLRRPAYSAERLSQLILMAAIINHPEVFESVEEDLGRLAMGDERLDRMKQEILSVLAHDSELDMAGLKAHLISAGYEMELRMALSEAVLTHAAFAAPNVDPVRVQQGCREQIGFLQGRRMPQELRDAGTALKEDFSEENEQKIMALHDVNKTVES